jgi:menaquinone-dependent protoporphyrinogen oxidase
LKKLLVLYATREGHTKKVAEYVARVAETHGVFAEVFDVAAVGEIGDLKRFAAAVLAASIHAGSHEPEMAEFVRKNRRKLEELPVSFLSVSLSQAGAEDASLSEARRGQAASDVKSALERFFRETGWHPRRVTAVAGALPYSKYGFVKRLVMKQIVRRGGAPTDTSRDYEFTDWHAVEQAVAELLAALPASDSSQPPGGTL